jgi:hypothetical protein
MKNTKKKRRVKAMMKNTNLLLNGNSWKLAMMTTKKIWVK